MKKKTMTVLMAVLLMLPLFTGKIKAEEQYAIPETGVE